MLTVPKGSNTGAVLRLKGKGVPRRGGHGDELVKLKVMLPPEPNPELETFLSKLGTWNELRSAPGYAAMIISKLDFLDRAQLDQETLEVWIEEEWLVPSGTATEPAFSEADLARAKLIRDLKQDLGVNDEGVGVILNLLDQMHGLRKALADLLPSTRERSISRSRPPVSENGPKLPWRGGCARVMAVKGARHTAQKQHVSAARAQFISPFRRLTSKIPALSWAARWASPNVHR